MGKHTYADESHFILTSITVQYTIGILGSNNNR